MRKLAALIATTLLASLFIAAPSAANNHRVGSPGNSGNAPGQVSQPITQTASAQEAETRAAAAAGVAARAKAQREAKDLEASRAMQEKRAADDAARAEAATAQQASAEAARAARENPAAAGAARDRAEQAQQAATRAAEQAKGKSDAANQQATEVRELRKQELVLMRTARALGKIKAADGECLEFIENPAAGVGDCAVTRYVIRFQNGVDPDFQVRGMRAIKIPVQRTLRGVFNGAVADLNAGQLRALVNSGRIRTVEQDFEIRIAQTQNNAVWGLDRIDQPALPLSNTYTSADQGAGVRAYVVDTGVLGSHQDFSGRMVAGFTAINDGRGTVDCNGHGTHVAGTIAGSTYGVAKAASIVPVRVLDCNGSGFLSSVIAGLDWIAQVNPTGTPAVVNLSLGGGASATLDSAVENLVSRGITVAVAAGNSAVSACDASPARTPGALTIAASNISDGFASFSNFGTCVDMIAPGVSVTSTWISSDTSAAVLSGTSMAAPHVAGLVAVLMTNGYISPAEVEFRLESNAVATISGLPAGTPNLFAQLVASPVSAPVPEPEEPVADEPAAEEPAAEEPAPVAPEIPEEFQSAPVSPTITQVNLFRNAARVFWEIAPNGGSELTGHVLRIWERGQLVKKVDVSGTTTEAVARGLKWGVNYTFTVLAVNAIGTSEDSQVSEIVTPERTR